MKKQILIGALAIISAIQLNAQAPATPSGPQLLEKVTTKPGELNISYEKWRLPNGLTIFIHEDHSDPVAHVEVTYHVGSARETAGKSGFAHFFEHMMFQGSDHVADEEHFKIVEGAGGRMNGTTNHDRTNYFETVPKNYLETALWLEADRMGFLVDAVTQKKFETQRATVKNEKDQNVTNRPYGMLDEIKNTILYPTNHPYYWPTIGFVEDLNRVGVEDLKNFFLRWYGPNNASIVVAGDVNPEEVVKMVEKYFGSIPRGPEVRKQKADVVRLSDNVYANYGDKVYLPLIQMTYPTVPAYHPDEAALDILGLIMGNGNNSIFYRNFIKNEKALQAGASHGVPYGNELAGEFSIYVLSFPDGETNIEQLIKSTIEEFAKTGVTDEDIARSLGLIETSIMQSMQSVAGRAAIISQTYYTLGDKKWNVSDELSRYQKVTKEDIMRVFNQYIKGKFAAVVNIYPRSTNAAAGGKEDTKLVETSGKTSTELEYKGLTYKKPVDNFDRSKRPEVGAAPSPNVPAIFESTFNNGIRTFGTTSSEYPTVSLLFTIKGGNRSINDPSKAGLAYLTAALMNEGTEKYSAESMESELAKLGSGISFYAGEDATYISVESQKKNLDKTLALLEERLFRPKFTQEDFKRNQKQIAQSILSNQTDAGMLADMAFSKLLYGSKTILAEPVEGTFKTVKAFTLKDVQAYYEKFYTPELTTLVIVGDISQNEIMPKLEFLNNWKKKNTVLPNLALNAPAPQPTQIYLVDKYKASQSEIRVGRMALPYDYNGKYFKSNVMNFALSGNFNSRMNLNLREDKGITYGIYGGFGGDALSGTYEISAGVRRSASDTAIVEIFKELKKYSKEGMSQEEFEFTQKALRSGDALRYETPGQKARLLSTIATRNLPKDYIEQQNKILSSLTREELNQLASEMLDVDKMVIVVVGDKEKIIEQLKKLGYKINDYKLEGISNSSW
ncbi:MAG: insulinase family protein [Bacteroidia bacterium]|nr:insulinase family protein [Bacteroidia bacterium]